MREQQDKLIERARYEARAQSQMAGAAMVVEVPLGSQTMPAYLRTPYLAYERKIAELIRPSHRVLELGAGTGLHTRALLQTGAQVIASDISPNSLSLLKQRFQSTLGNLEIEVTDMERLPFEAFSFDVIASAGSLSYGEPHVVDAEIRRVLRPGGMLVCVDSLNHNPVYRINRWLHYLRGNRSKSTLKRMPDLARIKALGDGFSNVNVHYFGALSFAMPVLARLLGENAAQAASDQVDQLVGVKRSAFKFVLVAQGFA
jgi:ubiquinone/menaquinone biosynthesis C-methylase UbiE